MFGASPKRSGALRLALVWLALFAAYAATLPIDAFDGARYGGDEPHYLLIAESIVSDGDVDLLDEYRSRAYADFHPYRLDRHGALTDGRAHEPHGVGLPLLAAPIYALGGARAVELLLAAIAALAFTLAIPLARRLVPDPWATAGPVLCGLSAPALAYSTAVYPELPAGAALAGASLLALRARERPSMRNAVGAGVLLAVLPWLGAKYLLPGAVIAAALVHWLMRRHRGLAALLAIEVVLMSVVAYITINDRLFGGLTPYAADTLAGGGTGADTPWQYPERAYRLVALWVDRGYGVLRWAPLVALAFYAVWLLWRSRRERIARVVPERMSAEVTATLLILVCGAQILAAAFLAPTMFGFWFPARHLLAAFPAAAALVAWGLRHAPRAGAVLAAASMLCSVWLYVELLVRGGGWVGPDSSAPLGPLDLVLPPFGGNSVWAGIVVGLTVLALVALVVREWRRREAWAR